MAALAAAAALCGCTQETQNQIGRAVQNRTGINGVLHIQAGDKLVMRFIRLGKLFTALGTGDRTPRPYGFGYGYLDRNQNYDLDPGVQALLRNQRFGHQLR